MPHDLDAQTPPRQSTGRAGYSDPALLPLAIIALLDGALNRHLTAGRDEAIGAALTAALTIAIDTQGNGNENTALERAEAIFVHLLGQYRTGIKAGNITGRNRGGFARGQR